MLILAIETSCDETSISILNSKKIYYSNTIYSQSYLHKKFGGVVPRISAKKHLEIMPYLLEGTLKKSKIRIENIDYFASTGGPGMINGLIVGIIYGKIISCILKKKFITINHLEGHILIPKLIFNISYPYILVLISGGHSQIIIVRNNFKYKLIGETIDDSIGETFDKVAKMLNLSYPGGPIIEKYASHGNEDAFIFLKAKMKNLYNFSFSGIKTSIKNQINKMKLLSQKDKSDICASFQKYIKNIIMSRLKNVIILFKENIKSIVLSGGVASNKYILKKIREDTKKIYRQYQIYCPPIELCTDNALMIAYSAKKRLDGVKKNKKIFLK